MLPAQAHLARLAVFASGDGVKDAVRTMALPVKQLLCGKAKGSSGERKGGGKRCLESVVVFTTELHPCTYPSLPSPSRFPFPSPSPSTFTNLTNRRVAIGSGCSLHTSDPVDSWQSNL